MTSFFKFLSKSIFRKRSSNRSQGIDYIISNIIFKLISALIKLFIGSISMTLPVIIIFCVLLVAVYGLLPSQGIYDGNYSINAPDAINQKLEAKYAELETNDKDGMLKPFKSTVKRFEVQMDSIDSNIRSEIRDEVDGFVRSGVINKYEELLEVSNEKVNSQFDMEMAFLEPYHLPKSVIGAIDVLNNKQKKTYANLTAKELKTKVTTQEGRITIKTAVTVYKDGREINSIDYEKYIPVQVYEEISHAYETAHIYTEDTAIFHEARYGKRTKTTMDNDEIKYTYNVKTEVYYPVIKNVVIDKSEANENRIMQYMTDSLKMSQRDYSLFQIAEGSIRGDINSVFSSNYMSGANQNYVDLEVSIDEDYVFPLTQGRISCDYGRRVHPITHRAHWHGGLDIGAATGTPVYAVADGRVKNHPNHALCGNYIVLQHSGKRDEYSRYLHLDKFAKKNGASVRKGELIGYVGNTGRSTAPHLHFELYIENKNTPGDNRKGRVHPLLYIRLPKQIQIKKSVNLDYILDVQSKMQ